jgi:hypothetical protein
VGIFLGVGAWAHFVSSLSEIKAFIRYSNLLPSRNDIAVVVSSRFAASYPDISNLI